MCRQRGWKAQIETNGTLWIPGIEEFIVTEDLTLVCSPKTGKVHEKILEWCDHWKYIIDYTSASPVDGLPMESTQVAGKPLHIARPSKRLGQTIWVQPMDLDHINPELTTANTSHAISIAQRFGYRLCLQQHKMVGLP